ncbi:uncharacterized protein LOC144583453 [Pogona vitticeps]
MRVRVAAAADPAADADAQAAARLEIVVGVAAAVEWEEEEEEAAAAAATGAAAAARSSSCTAAGRCTSPFQLSGCCGDARPFRSLSPSAAAEGGTCCVGSSSGQEKDGTPLVKFLLVAEMKI